MLVMALAVVALSTTDSSTMRLMLLLLVLLAVILILTGSIIAIVTLRKRLKVHNMARRSVTPLLIGTCILRANGGAGTVIYGLFLAQIASSTGQFITSLQV